MNLVGGMFCCACVFLRFSWNRKMMEVEEGEEVSVTHIKYTCLFDINNTELDSHPEHSRC